MMRDQFLRHGCFASPVPPFDGSSGLGTVDIPYEDALSLTPEILAAESRARSSSIPIIQGEIYNDENFMAEGRTGCCCCADVGVECLFEWWSCG